MIAGVSQPVRTVLLNKGWNFVSIPFQPENKAIETVLNSVKDKIKIVWGFDNENKKWLKWKPNTNNNLSQQDDQDFLTTIEAGKGYWIFMEKEGKIDIVAAQETVPNVVRLYKGWNLVGYNGVDGNIVDNALESISGKWIIIWCWENGVWKAALSDTSVTLQAPRLNTLRQGRAYWIKVEQEVNWQQ